MAESLEERWTLEAQTARNLEAIDLERLGRVEDAIALYERNVAEGFPGDLPYGRLVSIYEKRSAFLEAARVLERAIEVFQTSTRRTAQDRRATLAVFRKRLKLVKKRATRTGPSQASPAESGSG
jgi:tetratricopeptide (TPR) repeat protein